MSEKLWGGRFENKTHPEVHSFTASLATDIRLAKYDLRASAAHATSLQHAGVLSQSESQTIVNALLEMEGQSDLAALEWEAQAEDVHSEIERLLTAKIGPVAGKLHTGRSRNDQVVTATRLYLRDEIDLLLAELKALQSWFVETAELHLGSILPGLTHLQHAQPVTLAHHLMAYYWMFARDAERLRQVRARVNVLPLGAGALAGTPFSVDRAAVAEQLGFEGVCENSLDAVSDRDFIVETVGALALMYSHISKLAEEWIRWATPEVGFIALSDRVTTGSSLMPQKKNPDVAELLRGRSARVTGNLTALLVLLKGLPLSYNRDLQEDKPLLFDSVDSSHAALKVLLVLLEETTFQTDKMRESVEGDFSNATEVADFLVKKGVPFRQSHEIVGKMVLECLKNKIPLEALSLNQLQSFHPSLDNTLGAVLSAEAAVAARSTRGGTAASSVKEQIRLAKEPL